MRSKGIKILVVGVGFMGAVHARTVQSSRLGRLSGVVDSSEATAKAMGAEFGVPGFTDLRHAIGEIDPDAAIIATPDSHHREPAETLIDAGIDVLIEKPLATTVEDAEAMIGLAEERGTRVMIGHITRFYPRYTQVAEAVQSGELGKPMVVTTSTWGLKSLGARVSSTTNPLWHFAIHDIDLVQWLTGGVIDEVSGANAVESPSGVSAFTATGTLTTGAIFNLATGWTLPDSAAPRWDLKVHCEHGLIQATWSTDGVTKYVSQGVQELDCMAWPSLYGQVDGALRFEVDHFLDALAEGAPFLVTPDDALNAVRSAAVLEKATTERGIE